MDSELYLKKVSQKKNQWKAKATIRTVDKKNNKNHRRPYSAGRWKKQSKQKYGNLASGGRRTERKYNFFSLNVLGKTKQTKKKA